MNQSNVNILDLAAQKLENKEPKTTKGNFKLKI